MVVRSIKIHKFDSNQKTQMTTTENGTTERVYEELEAAKEEIKKLKDQLLLSNNELLQYAYAASHDLQEPLRKIQVYSSMLRNKSELSDRDHQIVEKIISSSGRMGVLITDILEHSKVVRSGKISRPVNLNDVVTKVIGDFELAVEERKATITATSLPIVNALALEMNQLFYNLIDNALKFADPTRKPQINIGCKKLDTADVAAFIAHPKSDKVYFDITVSDNGVGFNVKYAEQIFKVFGRLHPKDVYPGSGIGLPLCRSIMANHEGVLFAESKSGEGSTFHIIIPQ